MIINQEIRQTPFYNQLKTKIQEGYFIEKSVNRRSGTKTNVTLYTLQKQDKDGGRTISCYFAYDVAKAIEKEFNTPIKEKTGEVVWLNDYPEHYKPHPGHKITLH